MTWHVAASLTIVAFAVIVLVREWAAPAGVLLGGLVLFVLVGILPTTEAFLGFSNPATISIAGLFVVARAVRDHGGLEQAVDRLLGDGSRSVRAVLGSLVPPMALSAGIVNNTPLVATIGPILRDWAQRRGVASTHLLIPLSFAAIVGGLLTTIGTASTLVVSGVLESLGHAPFGLFTVTPVAAPIVVLGGLVVVLAAPKLLPDRRSPNERTSSQQRSYSVRLRVRPDPSIDRCTVAEAGLRDLSTTYLASITRDGHELAPVSPATLLHAHDELVFVGRVEDIRDLLDHPGLSEAEDQQTQLLDGDGHHLVECIVAASSPLASSTLKEASFRGRYGGVVVAIHRAGERVEGKLGAVGLQAGDALLVLADDDFAERWQGRSDFAVVVPMARPRPPARDRYRVATLMVLATMVVVAASGWVPILVAVLAACSVLVATRAISFRRAIDSLDLEVLLIVGSAIGLGLGLQASGAASYLAAAIAGLAEDAGPLVALTVLVLGTLVLTELITNVAAAALVAPIAIDTAELVGADATGFAVAVAIAAAASFLTPIGYQTNTLVYGLGGYRFGDFWRLGLAMVAVVIAAILTVVPMIWF